jgi:hypothetical protein
MTQHLTPPDSPLLVPPPAAEDFYSQCIRMLAASDIPFLLSGTYALACYTGISRPTKDVDVFAKAGDALKILAYFKGHGFDVQVVDERWLARIVRGELFMDVIFNMPTASIHVTDDWFDRAPRAQLFEDRYRYDGADVAHMILKRHEEIDWHQLLKHMELYWEVLLMALLNFRFIYPSERDHVPRWLIDELLERLNAQLDMPTPERKVCRGRIFSPRDYLIDVSQWGYSEAVGNLEEEYEQTA